MRVGLLIPHGKIGGIELHVLSLALGLIETGDTPIIIMQFGGGPLVDLLDKHQIDYVVLEGRNGHDLRGISRMIAFLRREPLDILHVHSVSFSVALALAFIREPTVVFSEHMSKLGRAVPWRTKLLWRFSFFRSKRVICVSDSTRLAVLEVFPSLASRAVTVYNGIPVHVLPMPDCAPERGMSRQPDRLVVGAVGRLADGKGWGEFLEIAHHIRKVRTDVEFQIIGDGPIYDDLVLRAKELGVSDVVNFLGYQPNPRPIVKNMDLYLLLSEHEACPLTLIEAFAEKTPVAGFLPLGGVSEVNADISPLSPERDTKLVAQTVLDLLDDAESRAHQADLAFARYLDNFTSDTMVEIIREIYESVERQ